MTTTETVTLHREVIQRLLKGPTHRLTKQQWQDVEDAMAIPIASSEQAHPTPGASRDERGETSG